MLYLPSKWHGGGGTTPFLFREDYEPEAALLPRLLKPGMVFVDGGANTGLFTFLAATLVGPSGRVVAFEPGEGCFSALQQSAKIQSAKINCLAQVSLRRQALSDQRALARLYHHRNSDNSFGLGASQSDAVSFEDTETITLTEALAEEGVTRLDVLKLDVEGAQELVLRGAREVLVRCRPVILLEVDDGASRRLNLQPEGAERLLRDLGYRFYTINDRGELIQLKSKREGRRVVAVPLERDLVKEIREGSL